MALYFSGVSLIVSDAVHAAVLFRATVEAGLGNEPRILAHNHNSTVITLRAACRLKSFRRFALCRYFSLS
jgi:hypothetical protein